MNRPFLRNLLSIDGPLVICAIAFSVVAIFFIFRGNVGINPADEGFLWYGVIRTGLGEVPIRDFMAYDPGRYYWGVFWSWFLGTGIMAIRLSLVIFQFLCVALGLIALSRVVKSKLNLWVAGVLLVAWMHPIYKYYDQGIAIAGVYFAVFLMEKPTLNRHFISGIFVGVAAFMGRNHGLYWFLSFFMVIFFVWYKYDRVNLIGRLVRWGSGIMVGYTPMLIMFLVIPEFFNGFSEISLMFNRGITNLTLSVPWPWLPAYEKMTFSNVAHFFAQGLFFVMMPLCSALGVIYLLFGERDSIKGNLPLAASIFLLIPYMHYAFYRADINHLANGIQPLLMGLLALCFAPKQRFKKIIGSVFIAFVFVMSFYAIIVVTPSYQRIATPKGTFVKTRIGADHLWVHQYWARLIENVRWIDEWVVTKKEKLLIAPLWTIFYPILERRSPTWEIFFIWENPKYIQERRISELENNQVNWIILGDEALDGRDDLRFRNTHRYIWNYIVQNFYPVKVDGLPVNYRLLRRKMKS